MASHYEITLQQKMGWLENVTQTVLVYKRDTVGVTMGGGVYEMTFYTMD